MVCFPSNDLHSWGENACTVSGDILCCAFFILINVITNSKHFALRSGSKKSRVKYLVSNDKNLNAYKIKVIGACKLKMRA